MCQLFHISPVPPYLFEALFWVDCPKMGTQHILEGPCGSTCLRSGWILISHELAQWNLPTPLSISQQVSQDLALEGALIPASHSPHSTLKLSLCTSPPKPGRVKFPKCLSTLKSQQENEQLTKLLHGFEELSISLIGTSCAFISSSEPHQTPARLNHFSWKMRNCESSRLPQQQSGNAVDK